MDSTFRHEAPSTVYSQPRRKQPLVPAGFRNGPSLASNPCMDLSSFPFNDICFGVCLLDVSKREILLDGRPQFVSHTAFDLLINLIAQRDHVVTKQTLGRQVWGERRLSEKLLAKTVMQIRKAIGDNAAQPQWIRNVHGVGYRFVGDITSVIVNPTSDLAKVERRVRVALLPMENRTGEEQFVWVELGLTTLVAQAMNSVPEVAPISMAAVLRALGDVGGSACVAERVRVLRSTLNAEWVADAFLRRDNGVLQLRYSFFRNCESSIEGTVSGHDPIQLGEELAQRLSDCMAPARGARVRFESDDPFVSQLMGRAVQYYEKREWRSAMQFVRTALIAEPSNKPFQLLLLRTLVHCADD